MPEFTSYDAGTPSWVDHASKDLEASNSFYGTLFGWEADDQGEAMGHYTLLRKGWEDRGRQHEGHGRKPAQRLDHLRLR